MKLARLIIRVATAALIPSCLAATALAQSETTSNPTPGVITGHIDAPGGESLTSGRAVAFPFSGGTTRATAKIDSSGNFKLSGLEPGLYGISVVVPGLIPAPNSSPDARRYYRVGDNVNLTLIKGGVITGKVTNAANVPMVAAPVRFQRVADGEGKRLPSPINSGETLTDDRGIYRRYSLAAGTYVVSTGGVSRSPGGPSLSIAYSDDLPTYAPSSTHEAASEFVVRAGDEITVDIQYRREVGHTISGVISGITDSSTAQIPPAFLSIVDVKSRSVIGSSGASSYNNYGFEISGLADGEYELSAGQNEQASLPLRVSIRGEDVTGLTLALRPLASIGGQVMFETDPKIECAKRRATARQETIISARRATAVEIGARAAKEADAGIPILATNTLRETGLNENSEFAVKSLQKGTYWIIPQPPDPGWFVKSIETRPKATGARSTSNTSRDGITINAGERISNVYVTLADGAGAIKGKVTVQKGKPLPARLRFYLVPAEKERSDNVLDYFEAGVQRDGTFSLANITPGRYFVFTRAAEDADANSIKSIKRDSDLRANILKAATTGNRQITLKPCEQSNDYEIPLTTPTSPQ